MTVKLSDQLEHDRDLKPHFSEAVRILEEVLGPSAPLVRAQFDETRTSGGKPLIRLTLSDHTGEVQEVFAPDEFVNASHMYDRLHHMWGDLLQCRSHKQVARLQELVSQMEEN